MYGQSYLEWVEGEACLKELSAAVTSIEAKHEPEAWDYAKRKLFPQKVVQHPLSQLPFNRSLAAQQQAASGLFGSLGWPR